jgi:Flp pilus assembly protein TadB
MSLVAAMLTGAAFGLGVFLAVKALRPGPTPLARVLADLEQRRPSVADLEAGRSSAGHPIVDRVGRAVLGILDATGLWDTGQLRHRLRTLDKPVERHVFEKLLGGIAGLLLPALFGLMLSAAGVPPSPGFVVIAALGLSVLGFLYADLGLAEQVERRRRGFRHALSAYLDLVTIILAGGGGLETALQAAADSGDGWAFGEIRRALRRARLGGRTPWDVFDALGQDLGIDELRELAASAHLAGDQGARIRASLAAKADSMRAHQTAAVEAQAEAATEKMLLPVVGLVVGMILFIGFGVVQAISTPGAATLPPP